MNQPTQNSPGIVVVDANIFISICSREPSEAIARAALADYTLRNWTFYAPSVIFTEVSFALCRKLTDGSIDAATHKIALEDFHLSYLPAILPRRWGMLLFVFELKRSVAAIAVFIPPTVFTSRWLRNSPGAVRRSF